MRLFADVASMVDDPFLAHALSRAERGRGATSPNPLVGCVIVRDGRIVGEGHHPRAGEPHAEVFALADAGEQARGADVYLTLEPCRHHGRTPPCTDALITAGVSRVVIGMADPTPEAGSGAAVLRDAGIDVEFAADPAPFAAANEGWLKRQMTGLPFVTAKLGMSLDARVAFSAGERAFVTGDSGAAVTRQLRSRADAVVVGAATVIADDPALTVRSASGAHAEKQPLRVVIVRRTVPAADARVFADGAAPTLVVAPDDLPNEALAPLDGRVLVTRYPASEGVAGAFRVLGERGLNEVLVEPGPRLLTSLWATGLLDEVVTVVAGGMAGDDALAAYRGVGDRNGAALAHPFKPVETGILGDVVATVWRALDDDRVQQ